MAQRDDTATIAREYADLFPAIYLAFHRRDGKSRAPSGSARGVLLHLAQSGPLTVGECGRHLGRAQSVVSEIVDMPARARRALMEGSRALERAAHETRGERR